MSDRTNNDSFRTTADLFLRMAIRYRNFDCKGDSGAQIWRRDAMRSCALKWRFCRDHLKGQPTHA